MKNKKHIPTTGFDLKLSYVFGVFTLCFVMQLSAMTSPMNSQENSSGLSNFSKNNLSHQNSKNFDIFADLIIWTAKEAGADCWAETITSHPFLSSNDLEQVHFKWDPGFRVGIAYKMDHDEWNIQIYYTWFRTHGKDRVANEPGSIHSTFLGNFYVDNPLGLGLSGPSYQSANIDWKIHFNVFDWELGRQFWISKSLAFRPFVGIKGGKIDQFIHSQWKNPNLSGAEFFNVAIENIKNNFIGIGPEAGINSQWIFSNSESQIFSLFGDFSLAIMWGHWSFSDVFKNDIFQQVPVGLKKIHSGASIVRLFMGFEWETYFSQHCTRLSTKLGYEMQFWFDQLQFYSFTGGRLDNELTLQGGTLEFCYHF